MAEGLFPTEESIQVSVLDAVPDFSEVWGSEPCIIYAPLDELGRCGIAEAILTEDMLTAADRPDMSAIILPGLHNVWFDFIKDGWIYNRCHLIGHRFGGVSSQENLMTGTHALNYTYMLPWENQIADYMRKTGDRVYYRVTPQYEGDELVCRTVLLEAMAGKGKKALCFSVVCPNVQPGVAIDYATGYATTADDWENGGMEIGERLYAVNIHTGKFHLSECEEVQNIKKRNRKDHMCNRTDLLAEGFVPCGRCHP